MWFCSSSFLPFGRRRCCCVAAAAAAVLHKRLSKAQPNDHLHNFRDSIKFFFRIPFRCCGCCSFVVYRLTNGNFYRSMCASASYWLLLNIAKNKRGHKFMNKCKIMQRLCCAVVDLCVVVGIDAVSVFGAEIRVDTIHMPSNSNECGSWFIGTHTQTHA